MNKVPFRERFERYLLDTGKYKWLMSFYFETRYSEDIHRMLDYLTCMDTIERGGQDQHDTYQVFFHSHLWTFNHYIKIVWVLFYLDKIERIEPREMSPIRIKRSINGSIQVRKEDDHG